MKKILCVILALTLVFTMSSCGKDSSGEETLSPIQTVDAFLQALKAKDTETLQEYYEGEIGDLDLMKGEDDPALSGLIDIMTDKLLDFDYTLSNEQIDKDKATVDVTIKTIDFGAIMKDLIQDILQDAFALGLASYDQEELEEKINEIMTEKFSQAVDKADKTSTITVPVKLVKKKGKWLIKDITDASDFMNALSGGLMEFAGSLDDIFG